MRISYDGVNFVCQLGQAMVPSFINTSLGVAVKFHL